MTTKTKNSLDSLRDLINQEIADYFVLDTSSIGINSNNSKRNLKLYSNRARQNNVPHVQFKNTLKYTRKFLEFLHNYDNVGATGITIQELKATEKALDYFRRSFGNRRNIHKSRNGFNRTPKVKKEREILEEIIETETKIRELLEQRIYEPNKINLKLFKDIVLFFQTYKANDENSNDEKIVASALYRSFAKKEHVAITTRDHRFKIIIENTQRTLNKHSDFKELKEFLDDGNLSILFGHGDEYWVDYNSGDFKR